MKRKEYTPEELLSYDPKRSHYDPEYINARANLELKQFIDNYYIMRSEAAHSVISDGADYEDGLYFPIPSHHTTTREARQTLINNYDLFYLSHVTGWAEPMVTHLQWPRPHSPVYGFHPPLRRLPSQDELQVAECI